MKTQLKQNQYHVEKRSSIINSLFISIKKKEKRKFKHLPKYYINILGNILSNVVLVFHTVVS